MSAGDNIRIFRTKMGLTPPQLAARAGVPAPSIFMWEKNRSAPDLAQIEAVARALGVPAAAIAGAEYARAAAAARREQETARYDSSLVSGLLEHIRHNAGAAETVELESARGELQEALRLVKAELRGRTEARGDGDDTHSA